MGITSLLFLLRLYLPIGSAVLLGFVLSAGLAQPWVKHWSLRPWNQLVPTYLGKFLFFVGVPLSIVIFLRRADLSQTVWLAPVVAWVAILLALLCSRIWIQPYKQGWVRPSQGTFSLAAMLGNTGYLGFPIVLLLPQLGPDYFGWALFYDVLGTLFGAYGLGVLLAERASADRPAQGRTLGKSALILLKNPTILAVGVGLLLRPVPLVPPVELALSGLAWVIIMLALVMMGMRLQQLRSWGHVRPAVMAVAIKMVLVPLVIGMGLTAVGIEGPVRLVLVLQSGMPCAFATLVLSETYQLDRDLAVTAVGLSSLLLLATLPLWIWGFATW